MGTNQNIPNLLYVFDNTLVLLHDVNQFPYYDNYTFYYGYKR